MFIVKIRESSKGTRCCYCEQCCPKMGDTMEKLLHEMVNWINSRDGKIMIGISGHGASGKTTFAHSLLKLLDPNEVNYINTDPYLIGSNLMK